MKLFRAPKGHALVESGIDIANSHMQEGDQRRVLRQFTHADTAKMTRIRDSQKSCFRVLFCLWNSVVSIAILPTQWSLLGN